MADERKFALPNSPQFRAFYAQKRRRSRNSNIPIVVPITKNFINLLGDPPQAYYELATPWVASGDFEIEVDFSTTDTSPYQMIYGFLSTGDYLTVQAEGQVRLSIGGANITTSQGGFNDGKLHKVKVLRVGSIASISVDGVTLASGNRTGTHGVSTIGTWASANLFFKGIISDVKITDITTPANSLSFGLDELTQDYEYPTENVFGSELVVNGDFATDTDWSWVSNWSIGGGSASMASTSSFTPIRQDIGLQTSNAYELSFDVLAISGSMKVMATKASGTDSQVITVFSTTGNKTAVVQTTDPLLTHLSFSREVGTASATIDNVSVKQVTNVLTYQNIAETSDVRDTYTLSNNDTQWISDLRTIDIAEQA